MLKFRQVEAKCGRVGICRYGVAPHPDVIACQVELAFYNSRLYAHLIVADAVIPGCRVRPQDDLYCVC